MKRLTTAIVLGAGLLLPLGAMADDTADVTIRVMEMTETQAQEVIRNIELPDAASDNAEAGLETAEQHRDQVRNRVRERRLEEIEVEQDQDMIRERDMIREQMRDSTFAPGIPGGIPGN